jgi:hypothetical protein
MDASLIGGCEDAAWKRKGDGMVERVEGVMTQLIDQLAGARTNFGSVRGGSSIE